MTAHAKLGPSAADRWMVCTASVPLIDRLLANGELRECDLEDDIKEQVTEEELLEQQIDGYSDVVLDPGRETTSYAAEGTVMHEVREMCLAFPHLDPLDFAGDVMEADGYKFTVTEDMADKLVPGIDWIRQHVEAPETEGRVDPGFLMPGQFGTCDAYWLVPVKTPKGEAGRWFDLYVSDLKFGAGEPVDAIGNRQLRLYALGAWHKLGRPQIRNVIMNIDQPRAGGMKFDEITFSELLEFAEEVKRAYGRIQRGEVEFVPSTKGCRWCPVRKTKRGCAAFNQWNLWMLGKAVMDPSREPVFEDPAQMSRAQRWHLVRNAKGIRAWLAKLHDESLAAAVAGDPDPGSKAVEGPEGRRFFRDEAKAAEIIEGALGDAAWKKKLIGFTEIDSLMKPGRKKLGFPNEYEELQMLVDRPASQPKLVSADHPSPAYQKVSDDDFDDLD